VGDDDATDSASDRSVATVETVVGGSADLAVACHRDERTVTPDSGDELLALALIEANRSRPAWHTPTPEGTSQGGDAL